MVAAYHSQDAIGDSIRMRHPWPRTIASGIVRTPVLGFWRLDDREHFRGRVIPQPRPCFMDIRQQTRRRTRQHPGLDVDDVAVQVTPAIQIAGIMLVLMARETMHHHIPISAAFLPRQACPVLWRALACPLPCTAPFLGLRALPLLLLGTACVTCRWCASPCNKHTDAARACWTLPLVVARCGGTIAPRHGCFLHDVERGAAQRRYHGEPQWLHDAYSESMPRRLQQSRCSRGHVAPLARSRC